MQTKLATYSMCLFQTCVNHITPNWKDETQFKIDKAMPNVSGKDTTHFILRLFTNAQTYSVCKSSSVPQWQVHAILIQYHFREQWVHYTTDDFPMFSTDN